MHVINDCTKKLIITNISTVYITTPKFSFMNLFNRILFSITKDYIYIWFTYMYYLLRHNWHS